MKVKYFLPQSQWKIKGEGQLHFGDKKAEFRKSHILRINK